MAKKKAMLEKKMLAAELKQVYFANSQKREALICKGKHEKPLKWTERLAESCDWSGCSTCDNFWLCPACVMVYICDLEERESECLGNTENAGSSSRP